MSKAAELAKAGETLTNQPSGRKNLVTNGAMQVAKRATSETGLGGAADSFPTCDRFSVSQTATAGRYTMTQTADGPSGFANCIKLDCTTADASIASNEFFLLRQRIEGQDVQVFAKGTSDAKKYALSFYVKGNASATYVAEIMDNDNSNRHVGKTFAVTTDWTRVEMIFPADTTGAFDDDNGNSLELNIWLHSGSDRTSGTLQQTWGALAQANRAVGISSFFSSTDNEFFITGVQLEVGSQATNFEHRSFGEELALCQRYYYKKERLSYPGATIGHATAGTNLVAGVDFPVTMRATPTVVIYDREGTSNSIINVGNNTVLGYTPSQVWWTQNGIASFTGTDALTANSVQYGYNFTADIEL